jgi:hypothetical protein
MPQPNDADAATVRDYLIALLETLWREQEDFSAKRPFGNSSWTFDVYWALGQAGAVAITFDADGYLDDFPAESQRAADNLIHAAIHALAGAAPEVTP